jgi:hypothetical protein
MKSHRFPLTIIFLMAACIVAGCRSRVTKIHMVNTSAQPLSIIEVTYPGGAFGKNSLAAGESYNYNIKTLDDGVLKLQFTDAEGRIHRNYGPALKRDQEGSIEIKLTQASVSAELVP